MSNNYERRRQVATRIVEQAIVVANTFFAERDQLGLSTKQPNDFVSQADSDVEQFIRNALFNAFPDDDVLGEEAGGTLGERCWVIDPIDGTANFLRGSPLWGISLGYLQNNIPMIGVIAYPQLGIVLSANTGSGLFKNNDKSIRSALFSDVKMASVGENVYWDNSEIASVEYLLRSHHWGVAGYRCATIGLGFAALGYTDGYIEKYTSVWDIAAGVVIAQEAGLVCEFCFTLEAGTAMVVVATDSLKALLDESDFDYKIATDKTEL